MSTPAQVRRRRKPDRKIRLTRPPKPDAAGVIVITIDSQSQAYTVTPLRSQFGEAAFRVGKVELVPTESDEPPQPRETAHYNVCLDGERSSCECLGFLRHRHCKHVEGLTVLRQRGLI